MRGGLTVLIFTICLLLCLYIYSFMFKMCVSPESIITDMRYYKVVDDIDCELSWVKYLLRKLRYSILLLR